MHSIINRQPRDPAKFDVLDLFDAIGRDKKYVLGDAKDEAAFVDVIAKALSANKTPTMIYGRRIEAMFAYMAASMGKCAIVKKEDSGDVFSNDDGIEVPDYRIVLNGVDSENMLVEVKNYNPKGAFAEYVIKQDYLDGLSRYADLVKTNLYIAIYWSKWRMWSLVLPSDFERKGKNAAISLNAAMKRNQMSVLGDVMIGTAPSLSMRIYPDKHYPHNISDNSTAIITIARVELLCKNTQIVLEGEQRIAFSLMMFGQWKEENVITTNPSCQNEIDYIEFSYSPEEYNDEQGFCIVGSLSTIISRQYGELTAPDGKVQCLTPNIAPGLLGFVVPEDYKGVSLPLWRFQLQPNYE